MMEHAGRGRADETVERVRIGGNFQRKCIVRCEFESGNRLLFDQMCDGAERHDNKDEGSIF